MRALFWPGPLLRSALFNLAVLACVLTANGALGKAPEIEIGDPKPLPEMVLLAEDGAEVGTAALRGQVTVLNLWATWCAPCKVEMPTLGALQAELEDAGVTVVALALERTDPKKLREALDEIGGENLTLMRDPSMASLQALGAPGIPITLLLDPQGREVFRHLGDATWDAPEVVEAIRRFAEMAES